MTNAEDPGTVTLSPLPRQAGVELTATLADQDVPEEQSVGWSFRYAKEPDGAEGASEVSGAASCTSGTECTFTPNPSLNTYYLRVEASYTDGFDTNTDMAASDWLAPPVVNADEPPVIRPPPEPPQVEENTATVGSYTASDPDGDPITWLAITSTGTDKDAFELTGTATDAERTLQFKADALPNFEEKDSYTVTLQVSSQPEGEGGSTAQTAELPVTVEILNAEDEGTLVLGGLTSAPLVGTALVAQLTDEDGNISPTADGWQWQRKEPAEIVWEDIAPAVGTADIPPAMNSYTPTAADINHELRV